MRPLVRKNPANGVAEVSHDGGSTWWPAPAPPAGSPGEALVAALRGVGLGVADAARRTANDPAVRPTIPVGRHA
jgi:hypothetical protein